MQRTISIKLNPTKEQSAKLLELQQEFAVACNTIVPIALKHQCWNRVALHQLAYYDTRHATKLGSQMVCNALFSVCSSYKTWVRNHPKQPLPSLQFRNTGSVHFDKRTYTWGQNTLSLYTLSGRIHVSWILGNFQQKYLERGKPKEAELVRKGQNWFFHLVLDIQDPPFLSPTNELLGVDLGENNLATLSSGRIFGGGELRQKRDNALALRKRLQSNGTKSSKQLLKKVSGKEARHVKHLNHVISKQIVEEALAKGLGAIAMESLTNIRKRIKAGKRVRSRLHRWAWKQLQQFVQYKAEAVGLRVIFVNPAYTSKTCSECGQLGTRDKHRFSCKNCGTQQHSDLNASRNICKVALSADNVTGDVNRPYVAMALSH